MQRLLVLGGGTAGTMVVNKLRRKLDPADWQITIVDQDDKHLYQPGFLFIPFGVYQESDVARSRHRFIPDGVELVLGEIDRVDADAREVLLTDGRRLGYDYLVIATGSITSSRAAPIRISHPSSGSARRSWSRTASGARSLGRCAARCARRRSPATSASSSARARPSSRRCPTSG